MTRSTRSNLGTSGDANMKMAHIGATLGFKAKKGHSTLPVKKGKKVELIKSILATEKEVPESVSVLKAEPVQVNDQVKRVYRKLDQKSYLVWGLTSDWMVSSHENTNLTRTSSRLQAASTVSNSAVTSSDVATETSQRDDASEGYGEMTAGSIQRMLNVLQMIQLHIPQKGVLPKGKSAANWALTEQSSYVDIGSGYGKVVFHAALAVGMTKAHGVEYVQSRHDVAAQLLTEYQQSTSGDNLLARLERVSFACQDATADSHIKFSHVYMYDKVFADKTVERLAAILNRSTTVRVLISYKRQELWYRLGLSSAFVEVTSLTMNTTGNQSFRCHVFVKTK